MKRVWLNKRLYEGLPFAYMGVGVALTGSLLLSDSGWSLLSAIVGLSFLTGGLVLLLRRRGYRASRSRTAFDERL
jgi:hypothetical protein